MKRIRPTEDNVNLIPGFWNNTWEREPAWRKGFGIDPARFGAMMAKFKPTDRVLDVCGGRGEFLNWVLPEMCGEKWMMDLSTYGVMQAKHRPGTSIYAVPGSCYEIPFRDNWFDVVVCAELIEHLETPDACIAECSRVCKVGGWVTITTPDRDKCPDIQHVWEFDENDVRMMLGIGCEVVTVGNNLIGYKRKSLQNGYAS